MKIHFFLTISFCFSVLSFSQDAQTDSTKKDSIIYFANEITTSPSYIGGNEKLSEYLSIKLKNLRAPKKYIKASCKFIVKIECIIESDGKITNVVIPKKYTDEMDSKDIELIMQAFLKMPNWNPGTVLNEPKKSKVTIPIVLN